MTYRQFQLPLADRKRQAVIALLNFADGLKKEDLNKMTDKQLVDLYQG